MAYPEHSLFELTVLAEMQSVNSTATSRLGYDISRER